MNPTVTLPLTLPLDTPIGPVLLECDGVALTGVRLPGTHHRCAGTDGAAGRAAVPAVLEEAAAQLTEYFAGTRRTFDVALSLEGTPFQHAVWGELTRIGYGETVTYGELARRVGCPRGPRAVGQANGRNPVPIIVPCHRVVAGDGIGGYGGGVAVKRALLALEGWTGGDGPDRSTGPARASRSRRGEIRSR